MSRWLMPALMSGSVVAALGYCLAASAQPQMIRLSCKGAILNFERLGDERLAVYQDAHGHRIELWCTRRIFNSQFDLRIAVAEPAHGRDASQHPVASVRLSTVGGCFFDDGNNEGPFIVRDPYGAYAKVEWMTEDLSHEKKYRFSYDFATKQVTITATVRGCAPVSKVLAPQPTYKSLAALLPHPETEVCAVGALRNFGPDAP